MVTVIAGALRNIILNTIFIFGLNMGVTGATVATIISQAVSTIWIMHFLTSKKSMLKLSFKDMRIDLSIAKKILYLGSSWL